jgi:hypothetical protein
MSKQGTSRQRTTNYTVKVGTNESKFYRNDPHCIRITEGLSHWKKIVAKSIATYLEAPSRYWDTALRADKNAELLCKYLNNQYPEFSDGWEFRVLHSQDRFDIVCLAAGVIIEVKSVKDGHKHIIANATIYPDAVKIKNALSDSFAYPVNMEPDRLNDRLDVLVVCVNQTAETVVGFAIVDGSYWAVNEEIYNDCIAYYSQINELSGEINNILAPINSFAKGLRDGLFGEGVKLDLRKLIKLTNPVGRLNIPGVFAFCKI